MLQWPIGYNTGADWSRTTLAGFPTETNSVFIYRRIVVPPLSRPPPTFDAGTPDATVTALSSRDQRAKGWGGGQSGGRVARVRACASSADCASWIVDRVRLPQIQPWGIEIERLNDFDCASWHKSTKEPQMNRDRRGLRARQKYVSLQRRTEVIVVRARMATASLKSSVQVPKS
ncbi:hypothetical protein BOTBODRAFT_581444 [Botryobasidium botryosum FD-172 SS1]|uniref:Uncharacterized protein n=1 Tax=Botryobasidium botryosum (strain FD-172 SS1) TaxID=930990 RepID=A0A067MSN3_BOTB1|nr:hypothetical protein BOTBODRAFT_581444 [Botryobasidium botryosum FD-172 SS1]